MSSTAGRVVAGIATGGWSEAARAASKAFDSPYAGAVVSPLGAGVNAITAAITSKPNLPGAGVGPTAPTLGDAARQAQLDEQKRQQERGPSDITNVNKAVGILTDPAAKYVRGQMLGGA